MPYTPENNPLIPGDPYSYDLKWMVNDINYMEGRFAELDSQVQEATDQADRANREADRSEDEADRSNREALVSEGFARGTQDGDPVDPDSPYYENNAEYFKDEAAAEALEAEGYANGEQEGIPVGSGSPYYQNSSKYYRDEAQNIADHIADPVAGIVADWLTDHITNPSNPPIDTSLSVPGAAADAAVVGDAVENLHNAYTVITDSILMGSGTINIVPYRINGEKVASGTGVISPDATYARCDYTPLRNAVELTSDTLLINICFYDENKQYISGTISVTTCSVPTGAKFFIFSIGINTQTPTITLTDSVSDIAILERETHNAAEYYVRGNLFPENLVDTLKYSDGYYVSSGNGKLVASSGYFATDYIPVTAGTTYKANKGRNYAWYNASLAYISGANSTDISTTGTTAPTGAAYIRFTVNKSTDGISNPNALYFTELSNFDEEVTIPNLKYDPEPWCYGKSINWIGDSIVAGQDFDEEVCAALGMTETDYGINGSTIALAGDGTDGRNAVVARYSGMGSADIIAVSAGTNDFQYAWCPIGDITSTSNSTFYGALKNLCEGLITMYPEKVIFFTTPIKRGQEFEDGNGGTYTPDGIPTDPWSKNKYGLTLMDYSDIIKEVCGYYSIPVLDLNRESLLNPNIAAQQYMFDSVLTHPDATARKIMARRVSGWLVQLGYKIAGL